MPKAGPCCRSNRRARRAVIQRTRGVVPIGSVGSPAHRPAPCVRRSRLGPARPVRRCETQACPRPPHSCRINDGARAHRHESRKSLNRCEPAAYARVGYERHTAFRRMGHVGVVCEVCNGKTFSRRIPVSCSNSTIIVIIMKLCNLLSCIRILRNSCFCGKRRMTCALVRFRIPC